MAAENAARKCYSAVDDLLFESVVVVQVSLRIRHHGIPASCNKCSRACRLSS